MGHKAKQGTRARARDGSIRSKLLRREWQGRGSVLIPHKLTNHWIPMRPRVASPAQRSAAHGAGLKAPGARCRARQDRKRGIKASTLRGAALTVTPGVGSKQFFFWPVLLVSNTGASPQPKSQRGQGPARHPGCIEVITSPRGMLVP